MSQQNRSNRIADALVRWVAAAIVMAIAGILTTQRAEASAPGFIPALDQYGNPICVTEIHNCFK
jgi:hypothetical protein